MLNKFGKYNKIISAIVLNTMALFFIISCNKTNIENKHLIIYNYNNGHIITEFPIKQDDYFSISFIHSVNKSPVIDYFQFNDNNEIFVYKTIYYNYGAGVETEIENNESLSYGDDGSMIIDKIDKKIDQLIYYLSSIYDHKLKINDGEEISLWDICGQNIQIEFKIE